MYARVTILTAMALLLSGCATVDMTEMAGPVAAKTETVSEKNVVQRAATRLYSAFTSKGFLPKSSRKRVQSAASILLNGLEDRDLRATDVSYADKSLSSEKVKSDIRFAARHVSQTTKAAEIYLEMAAERRNLRKELIQLEQALLASRGASQVFANTPVAQGTLDAELDALNGEIAALKRVTDKFGKRVRNHALREMSERRAATAS